MRRWRRSSSRSLFSRNTPAGRYCLKPCRRSGRMENSGLARSWRHRRDRFWRFRGRHDGWRSFGCSAAPRLQPWINLWRRSGAPASALVHVLDYWRGMMPPSIPVATYRLQLTSAFGFDDAAELVPYLKAVGISHLYSSPFLKARAGSTHGYDVVEHNSLNPELGGDEAFQRLCDALTAADMGLILDFVPNHMGVHHADNPWSLDVLEWGPKSPYA